MKKLLLIYDTPGWACDEECKALERAVNMYAPGVFSVDRRGASTGNTPEFLAQYDVVFSTVEYHLPESQHPKSISQCSSYNFWIRKYSDSFPEWPEALKQWKWIVGKNADIFDKLTDDDHPRRVLLYHALDEDFWTPVSRTPNDRIRVGFAGHAEQASKGVALIREAVLQVNDAELDIKTWGPDRLSRVAMRDWYRTLDIYVCASAPGDEAGPRSPMEAGLCGIPVITTNAGQIAEMVCPGLVGFRVERTVDGIAFAIRAFQNIPSKYRPHVGKFTRLHFEEWAKQTNQSWANFFVEVANG